MSIFTSMRNEISRLMTFLLVGTLMFSMSGCNKPPTAFAGADQTISLKLGSASLSGTGKDPEGKAITFTWTSIAGPAAVSFTNGSLASTGVSGLTVAGTYIFRLTVKDNKGAAASDEVTIFVNQPPVANAGADQEITLPTSSVSLSGSGIDGDGSISSYAWSQMSGPATASIGSSAAANTGITGLTAVGVYVFRLTVTDNKGETAFDEVTVTVKPKPNVAPTANAGIDQTISLPITSAQLSGSGADSDGTIATYAWTQVSGPATGTFSAASSASTDISGLTAAGTYVFRLTVTDNSGATAFDEVAVLVNQPPVADAGADQLISLPLSAATLIGNGTDADGNIASFAWSFVSGPSTAVIGQPTSSTTGISGMTVAGTYVFRLTVTDNKGATATDEVSILVNQPPAANAGADQTISLPVSSAQLSGSATDADGTIATYTWTQVSGPANATIAGAASAGTGVSGMTVGGAYIFRLTVTDNKGGTSTDDVTIFVNQPPVANAGTDQQINLPTSTAQLSGSGIDADGSITTYAWTQVSGPANVTFAAASSASSGVSGMTVAGTYVFRLTVTDNNGATSSDEVSIFVNQPPVADAGADKNINLPTSTTQLNGSGTDADGTVVTYAWTQVSGPANATLSAANAAATGVSGLSVAGVYTFKLTVTDNKGATASDQVSVFVNQPPLANAGTDQLINLPTSTAQLSGSGSDADGSVATYAWTQVSGPVTATITSASSANASVSGLTSSGTYIFRLTVTDNKGVSVSDEMTIVVNQPPVAGAGADQLINLPTSTAQLSGTASDADGSIVSYAWTLVSGPGTVSFGSASATATSVSGMTVAGSYVFRFTVTDNKGASTSDEVTILVNQPPAANAGADQNINLPTSSATLSGTGIDGDGTVTTYLWSQVSGPVSATITSASSATTSVSGMTASGTYVFRLTVTDNNGVSSSDLMSIFVNQPPTVNAGIDQQINLPSSTAQLAGNASDADGSVASYAWTLVSGPASVTFSASNAASTGVSGMTLAGSYVIRLTVTDNSGASASDELTIVVNQPPVANAGSDQTLTLPTSSATLSGSGSDADGAVASYAWSQISGPVTASLSAASSASTGVSGMTSVGVYVFRLTVTDNRGATSTDDISVTVNPTPNVLPSANAGADQSITAPTSTVTLNGSGADTDGSIVSYAWTKVSGPANGNIASPSAATSDVTGLVAGTYVFRLTVTDNSGGTASDDITVFVNTAPIANAGADQTITLPLTSVTLSGIGTDADGTIASYAWAQVSGPVAGVLGTPSSASTTVSGLSTQGNYVFRLTVTDNSGATATDDITITVNNPANLAPSVNAGPDQQLNTPVNTAALSGTAIDADGTIASAIWSQVSGPASVSFSSANTLNTNVNGLTLGGIYVLRLTVTDDKGAVVTDEISIVVNNSPTANAGADQVIITPASTASLTGGASDVDGSIVSYAWTQISGPVSATIVTPSTANTNITGLTSAGTYKFRLTVTDNSGATGFDEMNVIVNQRPSVNAGVDQFINLPLSTVTLTGIASDVDGTVDTYSWEIISGPVTPILSTSSAASTNASGLTTSGTYLFRLVVFDNAGSSAVDTVAVFVNAAPTVNAGLDKVITQPVSATSIAATATDADGTVVSTLWSVIAGPAAPVLSSTTALDINVTSLNTAGIYKLVLSATDDKGAIGTDTVNITVNVPPTAFAGLDQSITLPISNSRLNGNGTDTDGTIASYAWALVSAPGGASVTISSNTAKLSDIWGLSVAGTYTFRLTVTDNYGATATDDVNVVVNTATGSSEIILPFGANQWKYNDLGLDLGTTWKDVAFDDALWSQGIAALGYGSNQYTRINYGASSSNKHITYYFRKAINFTNPSAYIGVRMGLRRDDGAVVYVNGNEVYRSNVGDTAINWKTAASNADDNGNAILTKIIPISAFVAGNNVIAVEIHNSSSSSSDLIFDMEMIALGSISQTVTREPYLQMANGNAITIRWRTAVAGDSKVEVGTSVGNYTISKTEATSTTEHSVRVTGMQPNTKYYYRFGSTTDAALVGDGTYYFTTAPSASDNRKIGIAAFGDCGKSNNGLLNNSLIAYQGFVQSNPADLMLALGDNAYNNGTDQNYQDNFFNPTGNNIMRNHVLFPTPGNHEYNDLSARAIDKNVDYYNIFDVPQNAESGGVASGTESYYSFDWGNIHFISLDSYGRELKGANYVRFYDTTGAQALWLKQDLAANTKQWTVAFFHHSPHTMGSHNSDTESELISIRQNVTRILERYGVDMILTAHSHNYERSYLLKDYFLDEGSFNVATHALSSSSGKYDGSANSCVYRTASNKESHGTVYVVSGSAGGADDGAQASFPHAAMPFSINDGGMFYFTVEGSRLDAQFLRKDGIVADKFTIIKDAGVKTSVNINAGQTANLTASWKGNYQWSTGATTQSISVSPATTTQYVVTDGYGCISDTITVNVTPGVISVRPMEQMQVEQQKLNVFPVPVRRGEMLNITSSTKKATDLVLINETGNVVKSIKIEGQAKISTSDLPAGVYFLRSRSGEMTEAKKIIVMGR